MKTTERLPDEDPNIWLKHKKTTTRPQKSPPPLHPLKTPNQHQLNCNDPTDRQEPRLLPYCAQGSRPPFKPHTNNPRPPRHRSSFLPSLPLVPPSRRIPPLHHAPGCARNVDRSPLPITNAPYPSPHPNPNPDPIHKTSATESVASQPDYWLRLRDEPALM